MSIFGRLLNITLPGGGFALAIAEIYFDESEDKKHNLLCVAGCLFRKEDAEALDVQWNNLLAEYDLPYFHMVECIHGNKSFAKFKKNTDKRIEIQTKFMEVFKAHVEAGISITYDLRYAHLCPSDKSNGLDIVSPYALCCYFAMMHARRWASNSDFDGKISYFFESGHKHQGQSNHLMNLVFSADELKQHYRYAAHSFIPKDSCGAIQCADILAWQWAKNVKDRMNGKMEPRKDLFSLLEVPCHTIHFDLNAINGMRKTISESNQRQQFA